MLIHPRQHEDLREMSKKYHIPDIIPLDRNNDLPPKGVAILDDDSDSDYYFP